MKEERASPVHTSLSWSRGALEYLGKCPCCGHRRGKEGQIYSCRDNSSSMPDLWLISLCENCGSLYLDPRPDKESLPKAYESYYTHVATPEPALVGKSVLWALVRDYLHWRFGMETALPGLYGGRWLFRALVPWRQKLDRFGRHLDCKRFPKKGKLLDVGCGNGTFLSLARSMGWQAEGLEPDPKAAAVCRINGLEVIAEDLSQLGVEWNASYEAITLDQVIEHIFDPREAVKKCFQLLKPGGILWLGLPNPRSFGLKYFRESWRGVHPPYHLQMPTQEHLKIWLADAGFCRIETVRRGLQAKANWRESLSIAKRDGMRLPPSAVSHFFRLCADIVSVVTPRWSEETIVIAYRPPDRAA